MKNKPIFSKEEAQEQHEKNKAIETGLGLWHKFWKFLATHNLTNWFLIACVGVAGFLYIDYVFNKPKPAQGGYVQVKKGNYLKHLFDKNLIQDQQKKFIIKTKKIEDGKIVDDALAIAIDSNGEAYVDKEHVDDVQEVENNAKIDFTFRLGLAAVINAEAKEAQGLLEPGLVISPVQIYKKFALDGILTHRRGGAGMSYRLPFKRFRNTYIGGAMMVEYGDPQKRSVFGYIKINF